MIQHVLFRCAPLLVGTILFVGILLLFTGENAALRQTLLAHALLPQSEETTELYFDAPEQLPPSVSAHQALHFTFVIHNLETIDYQYTYAVMVVRGDTQSLLDHGTLVVKNGQYAFMGEQVALKDVTHKQQIVVALLNKKQSIDFWVGR
ncbi:hypothetical protein [Reticulibacter mediterranei]|nr:hypothetical protein [Reticulibacter mediterranei]